MDESKDRSDGWDGEERRANPVRRLLFAREVRDMMRELRPEHGRFARPDEDGLDEPPDEPPPADGDEPHTP